MRRSSLAILIFVAVAWPVGDPCATAGFPSRAASGLSVGDTASSLAFDGWVDASEPVARNLSERVDSRRGARHGWASQPWHTRLLQESASTEAPADATPADSETTEPSTDPDDASSGEPSSDSLEGERIEFDSYLADPQQAAREGLVGSSSPPWYSAEEDRAVPIGIREGDEPYPDGVDPGNRATDWEAKPDTTAAAGGGGGGTGPLVELPLTQLVWVALVFIFLLLAGLLVFALLRGNFNRGESARAESPLDEEEDPLAVQERIERLPFDLRHGVVDFLDEAQRLAAAGKYEEALVYLFSHALVQLDRAHRIRLAKGKTNRQYVGEIASSPPLAGLLAELAEEFERVFFGKYRLSQARYQENLDRILRFRHLLEQTSDA